VVGWVDLRSRSLWGQLERYAEDEGLVGFRHILQSEAPGFMMQDTFLKGLANLAEAGYTYDLLIYEHQLEEALEMVTSVPDTLPIVIDHIAKPNIAEQSFDDWSNYMAYFADRDNVFITASGMVTEANWETWTEEDLRPYTDRVLETFGPNRMIYGSDWPVCLVAGSYGRIYDNMDRLIGSLSEDEQEKILGGNAKKFYNLEG